MVSTLAFANSTDARSTVDELLSGENSIQRPGDEGATPYQPPVRATPRPQRAEPTPVPVGGVAPIPRTRQATLRDDLPPVPDFGFTMADLNDIIQAQGMDLVRLHICFPTTSVYGHTELTQGAAIAQAIALRSDLRPLNVSTGRTLLPGRLNVLVARKDELTAFVPEAILGRIGLSGIAMVPFPNFPDDPVLVITGQDDEGINEAILALGFTNETFPAAPFLTISQVLFPEQAPFFGQPPLNPGASYSFETLISQGAVVRPTTGGGISMQLFFPSDVFTRPTSEVSVNVHFSLGQATLRSSDAIIVRLNSRDVVRRSWDETDPSDLGGRMVRVGLPLTSFLPGRNIIEITTDARAGGEFSLGGRVPAINDFQIFTDSSIEIPNIRRNARLPDLRIAARTGFPFIGQPDGSDISFFVTNNNPETVSAAWTLISKIAQMSNAFMYAADYSFSGWQRSRHTILVGPQSQIPANLRQVIPAESFSELGPSQIRSEREDEYEQRSTGIGRWFTNISGEVVRIRRDGSAETREEEDEEIREVAGTTQSIGPRAVLTSFVSPENPNRWLLVLTAGNNELLLDRTNQVVRHPYWTQIRGFLFSWNETPSSTRFFMPDREFREVSFTETIVPMPFGIGISLRLWYVLIACLLLLFILATLALLPLLDRHHGVHRD